MFLVDHDNISITRGDTAVLGVLLCNGDGSDYVIQDGDEIVFTVKKDTSALTALIQKSYTAAGGSKAIFELASADTSGLDYGFYVYDVQLNHANGNVSTVVEKHDFEVREEVTF